MADVVKCGWCGVVVDLMWRGCVSGLLGLEVGECGHFLGAIE